ncbi:GDSL esterase/lipase [Striga hermonthica]|uniref:GDSL esterase/lipase n=1 Tax=Striga hermonthica TaxID=68872 RepID=A0A9N7MY31_STRHE|nr:GDSL esterase/lipase [Striga hermonthica]
MAAAIPGLRRTPPPPSSFSLQELIKLGANTILVPGNFPIGCLPIYLTQFKGSSASSDYDPKTGCLNWLNEFSRYHNELLQKELSRTRALHPHASIIYGDNYNAAMRFYLSPEEFGFTKGILRACCGRGGLYNFNWSAQCGLALSTCCEDPNLFASWDGVHFTEAAYRWIAQGLLHGPYTIPQISTFALQYLLSMVECMSNEKP